MNQPPAVLNDPSLKKGTTVTISKKERFKPDPEPEHARDELILDPFAKKTDHPLDKCTFRMDKARDRFKEPEDRKNRDLINLDLEDL